MSQFAGLTQTNCIGLRRPIIKPPRNYAIGGLLSPKDISNNSKLIDDSELFGWKYLMKSPFRLADVEN
jgi:hypothetical protein